MKRIKKPTIFHLFMLILISVGIFISSFHAHSDLEWNHAKTSCETPTHLSQQTDLCPVCGFRLKALPAVTTSFAAIEAASTILNISFESKKLDTYAGQITGRSPPACV